MIVLREGNIDTGANASAEEAEEELEAGESRVNNVSTIRRMTWAYSSGQSLPASKHVCMAADTICQPSNVHHPPTARLATDARAAQVVNSFRLAETQFDKKSYMVYLKGYMKAVKASLEKTNPERIPVFEKQAAVFAKKVLGNFKVSNPRPSALFLPDADQSSVHTRTTSSTLESR